VSERDRGRTSFTTTASQKGSSSSSCCNIKSLLIRCPVYIIEFSSLPSAEILRALNSIRNVRPFYDAAILLKPSNLLSLTFLLTIFLYSCRNFLCDNLLPPSCRLRFHLTLPHPLSNFPPLHFTNSPPPPPPLYSIRRHRPAIVSIASCRDNPDTAICRNVTELERVRPSEEKRERKQTSRRANEGSGAM
jgi:hypothetical protein